MASVHKECGANIIWMKSPNDPGRWMPPMEYAGEGYWVDSEMVGHGAHFYQPHVCDPAQVEAWIARLQRIADATGDSTKLDEIDIRAARKQADQESARKAAEKYDCDQCGAVAGKPCLSKAKGQGLGNPTKWPHPDRLAKSDWRDWRNEGDDSDDRAARPTQGN